MLEEYIGNINKSGSNCAPTFIDHYVLPDIHLNQYCWVKSNIYL